MKIFLFSTLFFAFLLLLSSCSSAPSITITESIPELRAHVEKDLNNSIMHYNLGVGLLIENNYDEARAAFTRATEIDPTLALAHFGLYVTGYAADKDLFERISVEEPDTLDLIKSNLIDSHLQEAFAQNPFFDWRIATVLMEDNELIGNSVQETVLLRAIYDVFQSGFDEFTTAQYEEAVGSFTELIDISPDYLQAYLFRGLAYAHLKDFRNAIQDFQKVSNKIEDYKKTLILPVDINTSDLDYLVGYANMMQNRVGDAEKAFQRVLLKQFGYYMAHIHLANINMLRGNYDKALNEYNAATLAKPNDPVIQFEKGTTLMKVQKYELAIDAFNAAITSSPDFPLPYFNMGICQEKLGENAKAKTYFQQFIDKVSPALYPQFVTYAQDKIKEL